MLDSSLGGNGVIRLECGGESLIVSNGHCLGDQAFVSALLVNEKVLCTPILSHLNGTKLHM